MTRSSRGLLIGMCLILVPGAAVRGGDVVGRVEMPESCSPSVSPAVVRLEPAGGAVPVPSISIPGLSLGLAQPTAQKRFT